MAVVGNNDLIFAKVFAVFLLALSGLLLLFSVSGWGWPLIGLIFVAPLFGAKPGDELGKSDSDGVISTTSSGDSGGCDGC
jgi:hypothetical protein